MDLDTAISGLRQKLETMKSMETGEVVGDDKNVVIEAKKKDFQQVLRSFSNDASTNGQSKHKISAKKTYSSKAEEPIKIVDGKEEFSIYFDDQGSSSTPKSKPMT